MQYDKRFFSGLVGIFVVVLIVSVAGCTSSPSASPTPTAAPSVATVTPVVTKQAQASSTPKPTATPTSTSAPTSTPQPSPSPTGSLSYTGPFVGSKNSDVYHVPWCYEAQKIKPQNLVTFPNAKAAQAAGYRPCEVCKPETTV